MSFGSTGGFSFGPSNNNQSTSGFGGFGSNTTNTTTAFGSSLNAGTGFGASTSTSNPFGGSSFGTNTGASAGGFGSSANNSGSLFGANKTTGGFGANTGGSLFGNNASNTTSTFGGGGGGGFGASSSTTSFGNNNVNTTPGFSGFGGNKPAFGSNASSGTLFGQGGAGTTGGFGTSTSTGAFGSSGTGTALGQNVPPATGTAETPFNPTEDQDAGSATKSRYQSITMQPPYQKYSFEELRLADYNAGRRYGNGSGQAGAFGNQTFGGFSGNPTSGFGNNTNTNPFGGASSTPSGGLFGGSGGFNSTAPKPAGGLFGQQSSATSTGGLFGTAGATGTSFGQGNTGLGTNTSGGLFGNQQAKPTLFGNQPSTTSSGFSFGPNASTGGGAGGLFGTSNNTNSFGSNSQQQSGGLFSSLNPGQDNQQKTLFNGGGGGFAASNTQNQPGGLFSNTNSNPQGGGLFGSNNTNQSNPQGGLFGNTGSNTAGGLFGTNNQQQNKPSLFTNTNTAGGLFTNQNNQQTQGNSLFTNNNSSGGLFGQNTANKPATSLFGPTNPNQQSGGLFGQANTGSGGMFGASQNNMLNSQQQDGPKHASQLDGSPYTKSSIWTGLPEAASPNPPPLLTPLSASSRLKESSMKPAILRNHFSKFSTPARRTGYGFTYSTYGTPNSAASTPTGGLSTSMYNGNRFTGGSFGRSLHKSLSSSALRPQYQTETVLSPGAFTPGNSRYSSGSIRRLTVDRNLRTELFSNPSYPALPPTPSANAASTSRVNGDAPVEHSSKLKKRVSFDNNVTDGTASTTLNGETGALVRAEPDEIDETLQPRTFNGVSPEKDQTRGRELAAVPEDREPDSVASIMKLPTDAQAKTDPTPGDYYMNPTRAELSKLPRHQQMSFRNFEVGRNNCGHVVFNDPVDLTSINLDDIFDKLVEIRVRSITVYPDPSTKPPRGKGLNVPSTLYIENSWPRSRGKPSSATAGQVYDKHVARLKRMGGTDFVGYDAPSGVWTFRVPHYTRYGLDYDDDEDTENDIEEQDSHLPITEDSLMYTDQDNSEELGEDDTFAFKQKIVPGGFDKNPVVDDDFSDAESLPEDMDERSEVSIAGQYPEPEPPVIFSRIPSTLKPQGSPVQPLLDLDGDWADQLQRTISPRKQNRETLREHQSKVLLDRVYSPIKPQIADKTEFQNSIDLMNSLFGKYQKGGARKQGKKRPNLEFPYSKRSKEFDDDPETMTPEDKAFHYSFRPKWIATGSLLVRSNHPASSNTPWTWEDSQLAGQEFISSRLHGDGQDVSQYVFWQDLADPQWPLVRLHALLSNANVEIEDGVPYVEHQNIPFSELSSSTHQDLYELAHILFDDYNDKFTIGLSSQDKTALDFRIRRDRLSAFLAARVETHSDHQMSSKDPEERAIIRLAAKDVAGACQILLRTKDYNLAMLVSQIEQGDKISQNNIGDQLEAWKDQNIIGEMSDSIRTLYEILSGNTTISYGKGSGPLEDRASQFIIAERFDLSWLQSFGLHLWYGRTKNDSLATSIRSYASNITANMVPFPGSHDEIESPLWVLLNLYASGKPGLALPQTLSSLSAPFDCSMTFQMHHALVSRLPGLPVDTTRADQLARDLAFQYSASGSYLEAIYALMHLSGPEARESSIRDVLTAHAASLPDPVAETATTRQDQYWFALTLGLRVPQAWIHEAKALFARSQNESDTELQYLMLAELWTEAHECFCRRVAPRLVIDEDWSGLKASLAGFGTKPEQLAADWDRGGDIYSDFSRVMSHDKKSNIQALLRSLHQSLSAMGQRFRSRGNNLTAGGTEELEERVACNEMSRQVAQLLTLRAGAHQDAFPFDLPLTADARLQQARDTSANYYRASLLAAN